MVRSYNNRGRDGQLGRNPSFRPRGRGKLQVPSRNTAISRPSYSYNRNRRGAGGPRGPPATAEGLDAQLEAYMGDDVVKQQLDRDLDAYFSNSATADAAAPAAATAGEADAGTRLHQYSLASSARSSSRGRCSLFGYPEGVPMKRAGGNRLRMQACRLGHLETPSTMGLRGHKADCLDFGTQPADSREKGKLTEGARVDARLAVNEHGFGIPLEKGFPQTDSFRRPCSGRRHQVLSVDERWEAAAKDLDSGAFWREADRRLLFLANTFSPAAIAAAAAALATAKRHNTQVLRRLELRAIEVKNEFSGLQAALLLNAFSRLAYTPHELLPHFAEMLIRKDKELVYEARALALLANAFARMAFRHEEALGVVCRRAEKQINECCAQDVSNLFNALHRLAYRNGDLLQALERRAARVAADMKPQHLANCLSALAAFGAADSQTVEVLAAEIPHKIEHFSPQEVGACYSALATLHSELRLPVGSLLTYFVKHHKRFSESQAVAVLHAAASLRKSVPIPTDTVEPIVVRLAGAAEALETSSQVLLLHASAKVRNGPTLCELYFLHVCSAARGIWSSISLHPFDVWPFAKIVIASLIRRTRDDILLSTELPAQPELLEQHQAPMGYQQGEQRQKTLITLLHAFAAAERRHVLCDQVYDALLRESQNPMGALHGCVSVGSRSSSAGIADIKTSGLPAAVTSRTPVLPNALAAIVAHSIVRLKAFDRKDIICAIAESVSLSDAGSFTPQQLANILFALERIEYNRLLTSMDAEARTAEEATGTGNIEQSAMLKEAADRLSRHATIRIKQVRLRSYLRGGGSCALAHRAALDAPAAVELPDAAAIDDLQHGEKGSPRAAKAAHQEAVWRSVRACFATVPLLSLQGTSGLHASTALLAALIEGSFSFGRPSQQQPPWDFELPAEVQHAIVLLLQQCASAALKMNAQLFMRFTTATADLRAALSPCEGPLCAGSSNSATSIRTPSRLAAAGVDSRVITALLAAKKAQEQVLFWRLDRLDVPLLLAFANAVAAPRSQAAAAITSEGQEQQQLLEAASFAQRLQQFLPLKLLRKETMDAVCKHSLPRAACADPAHLLQHWRVSSAAVAASAALQQHPQQHDVTAASSRIASGSAADFLIQELPCFNAASAFPTPASYARHLVAFAELARPAHIELSSCPQQDEHPDGSSTRLDTGPERVLCALLSPLRACPGAFPPPVCAAAVRVAMECGVGDPLLLERVMQRLIADEDAPDPDTSGRSSLPAAAFVDLLRGAAAASVITRPAREALIALVDRQKELLLQSANIAAAAATSLQRLKLLDLPLLQRMVQQQVLVLQQQLQQQLQQPSAGAADLRGVSECFRCLSEQTEAHRFFRRATAGGHVLANGGSSGGSVSEGDKEAVEFPLWWALDWTARLLILLHQAHSQGLLQLVANPSLQSPRDEEQQQRHHQIRVVIPAQTLGQLLRSTSMLLPCRQRGTEALLAALLLLQHTSSSANTHVKHQGLICDALRVAADVLTSSGGALPPKPPSASDGDTRAPADTVCSIAAAAAEHIRDAETTNIPAGSKNASAALLKEVGVAGTLLLRQQVLPHFFQLQQRDLVSLSAWHMALLLQPAVIAEAAGKAEQMQGLVRTLKGLADASKKQSLQKGDRVLLALVLSCLRLDVPDAWQAIPPATQQSLNLLVRGPG
ncbi:hypothetical protein cyc_00736 [Cyclospora cayetanensis]|uniref:Chromatin target of PRMT1 protein C-terminal domain-containing protein n=1 Tax=Cyclospora cayetanensis TaxID=88456 RepID=A0A1D3D484_9EIME|nr:hypothetical protein cyc_00736 [Cyclospora cayetanensis]